MNDSLRVRGGERIKNLRRIRHRPRQRHWSFERFSLDKFHDEVVRSHIIDLANMGMIQSGYYASLTLEALTKSGFRHLQRDSAVETAIPRLPDFAHAARADKREKFVRAESIPAGKR